MVSRGIQKKSITKTPAVAGPPVVDSYGAAGETTKARKKNKIKLKPYEYASLFSLFSLVTRHWSLVSIPNSLEPSNP